jgi:hypothetical protein
MKFYLPVLLGVILFNVSGCVGPGYHDGLYVGYDYAYPAYSYWGPDLVFFGDGWHHHHWH